MNSCVYILYSQTRDRYYIGMTTLQVDDRLKRHNDGYYSRKFTSGTNDWKLLLQIPCSSVDKARELEQWIKRKKSRKYIEMLLESHTEVAKLILNFGPKSSP